LISASCGRFFTYTAVFLDLGGLGASPDSELLLFGRLRKLEDWNSEDEFGPRPAVADMFSNQVNKSGRLVVLNHVFALGEL